MSLLFKHMQAISKTTKSVLVVEDEPALLDIIAKRVTKAGYKLLKARDGEEAQAIAEKQEPDAVITDIIMPKKNGFDLIKALKQRNPELPVIVVTNLESQQDRETGIQLGVNKYVIKSNISLRELDSMLASILK